MIRRDGSPDEVNPSWDADCRPDLPEDWPPCDTSHEDCTKYATQVLKVPYLKEPLHVCDSCAAEEQRLIDGPSDVIEGPEWQDAVNRLRR